MTSDKPRSHLKAEDSSIGFSIGIEITGEEFAARTERKRKEGILRPKHDRFVRARLCDVALGHPRCIPGDYSFRRRADLRRDLMHCAEVDPALGYTRRKMPMSVLPHHRSRTVPPRHNRSAAAPEPAAREKSRRRCRPRDRLPMVPLHCTLPPTFCLLHRR